jgi:hypothetical protein
MFQCVGGLIGFGCTSMPVLVLNADAALSTRPGVRPARVDLLICGPSQFGYHDHVVSIKTAHYLALKRTLPITCVDYARGHGDSRSGRTNRDCGAM